MVAVSLAEYFFWGKDVDSFWCMKLLGTVMGLVLIPVLYYTYTGALGIKADWLNIAIFFLVAAMVYWVETKLFQREFVCPIGKKTAVGLLILLAIAFTVFTFMPVRVPLFQDPVTGTYGFQQ